MIHKYLLHNILYTEVKLSPEIGDKYKEIIDNIIILIKEILIRLIKGGLDISIYILRPLYILLIIIGITKYAISGLSPRSKNILFGGLLLAVFTEVILPILLQITNL